MHVRRRLPMHCAVVPGGHLQARPVNPLQSPPGCTIAVHRRRLRSHHSSEPPAYHRSTSLHYLHQALVLALASSLLQAGYAIPGVYLSVGWFVCLLAGLQK